MKPPTPTPRTPPPGVMFLPGERAGAGQPERYAVRRRVEVDGANLTDARAGQDGRTGEWVVNFTFDSIGTRRFADVTRANVGRPFAIVLDEQGHHRAQYPRADHRRPWPDQRQLHRRSRANDLAVLLRAGALPAPLTVVEERTVGPELGADAIRAGMLAAGGRRRCWCCLHGAWPTACSAGSPTSRWS